MAKRVCLSTILLIVILATLSSCAKDTGGSFAALGFLPSGMEAATGHRILYNTNFNSYALIPILEPFINILMSVFVNLIDFALWLIAWIPGMKQVISWIYKLPDLDLAYSHIFTYHRNIITHSALNPLFLISIFSFMLLSKFFQPLQFAVKFIAAIFLTHLIADTMPIAWTGFANIQVGLLGVHVYTFSAILSKLWLYGNCFIVYQIFLNPSGNKTAMGFQQHSV